MLDHPIKQIRSAMNVADDINPIGIKDDRSRSCHHRRKCPWGTHFPFKCVDRILWTPSLFPSRCRAATFRPVATMIHKASFETQPTLNVLGGTLRSGSRSRHRYRCASPRNNAADGAVRRPGDRRRRELDRTGARPSLWRTFVRMITRNSHREPIAARAYSLKPKPAVR